MSSAGLDEYGDLIGNSEPGKTGVYFVEGIYPILYVDKIQPQTSRSKEKLVIAEFDILESEVEKRTAGSRISQVYNLTKHADMAPGNVRALVGFVLGVKKESLDAVPEEQQKVISELLGIPLSKKIENPKSKHNGKLVCSVVEGEVIRSVLSEANPLNGRLVRATATLTQTREKKTDFTRVDYDVIPEEMQSAAKDLRAAAGFPQI